MSEVVVREEGGAYWRGSMTSAPPSINVEVNEEDGLTSSIETPPVQQQQQQQQQQQREASRTENSWFDGVISDTEKEEEESAEELKHKPRELVQEDEEPLLTEDAYSLLYTAPPCSRTTLFAWFSITLQGGMLFVTFLDLFDASKEGNDTNGEPNRMQLAAGSSIEVVIAQFLGMLVTAMVMAAEGDFVTGVTQLIKGFDPRIRENSPHTSWSWWLFTGLLQSIVGILLLVDSFILSMQSTSVIDLSMNLTALHFIQEIDNMSFTLGIESGLLGRGVQADCEHVRNLKGYSTPGQKRRQKCRRRILILLMTVSLLVPYFYLVSQQNDGHFICQNLYIQFGDQYTPEMAHYSGMFKSQGSDRGDLEGQRNYYVDETRSFKVAYCNAENYWTVSRIDDRPCEFIFRSAETETFDIVEAADLDWYVTTPSSGDIDADWLKIVCNDCSPDTCSPEFGVCSEDGDNCICNNNRFGLNCQFQSDCDLYQIDQRTRDGLASIPGTSSFLDAVYTSLDPRNSTSEMPLFYDRPILWSASRYSEILSLTDTSHLKKDELEKMVQVNSFMVYTGRRWVVYSIPDERLPRIVKINGVPTNWTLSDFRSFFNEISSAHLTGIDAMMKLTVKLRNLSPIFFSSPVNYGENGFGAEVTHVTWVHATSPYNRSNPIVIAFPDEQHPVSAGFLCADCNDYSNASNPFPDSSKCLNGGKCSEKGSCICPTYYTGSQCERVKDCVGAGGCSGVGKCNEETKTCECEEGSYGSLCQLGEGAKAVEDVFLCSECRSWSRGGYPVLGNGRCDNTFSNECTCANDDFVGKYCNESTTNSAG